VSPIKQALDSIRVRCDVATRVAADPVSVVHRYSHPLAQELVGLAASAVAFGNVKAFYAKLDDALERLGPDITGILDDGDATFARLEGWKHRIYKGDDLARLLIGARRVQHASGSLGNRFKRDLVEQPDMRHALSAFVGTIRKSGLVWSKHILPDPLTASGCKRLLLYLRWMIRPNDGVDLGLWDISSSILLIPVDVHIHRLSLNLGLTQQKNVSWKTAEEITDVLRKFDPSDPVKYDFALCHMGMVQHCPSRRDMKRCKGCGVQPVCRHWKRS
jgi:uncharacterized protein (TIGR02757 family)